MHLTRFHWRRHGHKAVLVLLADRLIDYWLLHLLHRLLFATPTSVVIAILTICDSFHVELDLAW